MGNQIYFKIAGLVDLDMQASTLTYFPTCEVGRLLGEVNCDNYLKDIYSMSHFYFCLP